MAVFGAMCSYIAQGVSFILLRKHHSHMDRPDRSHHRQFSPPNIALYYLLFAIYSARYLYYCRGRGCFYRHPVLLTQSKGKILVVVCCWYGIDVHDHGNIIYICGHIRQFPGDGSGGEDSDR